MLNDTLFFFDFLSSAFKTSAKCNPIIKYIKEVKTALNRYVTINLVIMPLPPLYAIVAVRMILFSTLSEWA